MPPTGYIEPTTVPDALRAAAEHIKAGGWYNIANSDRSTSKTGCCAVTAIVHVLPWSVQLREDAVNALAYAVAGETVDSGVIVGIWNDAQKSPKVVIDKMREVADLLEQ